ncbi:hypothetical protein GUJ93_ZPchr0008g14074 [Zizania palustris]|uniref:Zinc finger ZPR1-type domain-containing protein n=1 Tax=Zizania palustris TaxID=103762 RepID=A0A8J5R6Q8_ZIZPA|nr:hypothetical protein GUJ93_ZPchr0008g14074 [Zizania palustris]
MASSGEEGRVMMDLRSAAESAGDEEADATPLHEIESLCMRCGENGTTRLLLTTIPHFREVVLMAFECPHCGERNNEVQFAGQLQPKGCCYLLEVPLGKNEVYFMYHGCLYFCSHSVVCDVTLLPHSNMIPSILAGFSKCFSFSLVHCNR